MAGQARGARWPTPAPISYVLMLSVDRVNGWEAGLPDGLGYIHDLLSILAVLGRAGAIPSCDTTRKNAFYGASEMVGESHS